MFYKAFNSVDGQGQSVLLRSIGLLASVIGQVQVAGFTATRQHARQGQDNHHDQQQPVSPAHSHGCTPVFIRIMYYPTLCD